MKHIFRRIERCHRLRFLPRRKGFLICFIGVDGSGKTTQANSLINHLQEKGYPCKYVWAASRPILAYIFFAVTRLLGYWKRTRTDAYTDPLDLAPEGFRDKLGSIWRFFVFLDFQIKTLITVELPLVFGRIVVCDRYVYDLMMELIVSKLYSARFGKLILQTAPTPHITFLMDVPEDIAHLRRDNIPLSALWARRKVFLNLGKILGFEILDASDDSKINMQKIRNKTISRLESRFHLEIRSK